MCMTIYREEIIGPVVCVVRTEEFADRDTARSFAIDISVGVVRVNVSILVPMAFYSFGG